MQALQNCNVRRSGLTVEAEARSVNHRFLKVSIHLSPSLSSMEPAVEERVRSRVERGHVTISLRFTRSSSAVAAAFSVDAALAATAAKRLTALAKSCGLSDKPTLSDLLRIPGVVADSSAEGLSAAIEKAAMKALDGALDALVAARSREGAHLAGECRAILSRICCSFSAPFFVVKVFQAKLTGRIVK